MAFKFTDAERVNKLPAWAAGEIGRLEREIKRCHKLLTQGSDGVNVWADPNSDRPRPIGKDSSVHFGDLADFQKTSYEVRLTDGELRITAHTAYQEEMVVMPRVSNGVNIGTRKRS